AAADDVLDVIHISLACHLHTRGKIAFGRRRKIVEAHAPSHRRRPAALPTIDAPCGRALRPPPRTGCKCARQRGPDTPDRWPVGSPPGPRRRRSPSPALAPP